MAEVSDRMRQLRDEVADELAHLVAVATEAGSAVGEESRQRAVEALHALRGRRSSRWRWLLLGAAVGFVAGVTAAGAARRRQLPDALEAAGRGLAETVREKAAPVQDAAARAREKLAGSDTESTDKDGHDTQPSQ